MVIGILKNQLIFEETVKITLLWFGFLEIAYGKIDLKC